MASYFDYSITQENFLLIIFQINILEKQFAFYLDLGILKELR